MRFSVFFSIILFVFCVSLSSQELGVEYEWMIKNLGFPRLEDSNEDFVNALMRSDIKTLKKLVNYNYNVNIKYENGSTPLIYAVYLGDIKVIKFLINSDADVNTSANALLINVLGIDFSEYTMAPILLATIKNDIKTVQLLLKNNAQIDKKDSNDKTSLIWAVHIGYSSLVDLLLKAGADINYTMPKLTIGKNEYKNVDSLAIACIRNDYDTARILLSNRPFSRDKYLECLRLSTNNDIKNMITKLLKKEMKNTVVE